MTIRCAVYRRGTYPGQVDHPGWLSKVVEDRAALEAALADGWRLTMTDEAPAPVAEPVASPDHQAPEFHSEPVLMRRGRKPKVSA